MYYTYNDFMIATESGYHSNKKTMKKQIKSYKDIKKTLEDPDVPNESKIAIGEELINDINDTIKEIKKSSPDAHDKIVDSSAKIANKVLTLGSIVIDVIAYSKIQKHPKLTPDEKTFITGGAIVGISGGTQFICKVNKETNTIWYKSRKKSVYIDKLESVKENVQEMINHLQ